jgi:hypothetical protein
MATIEFDIGKSVASVNKGDAFLILQKNELSNGQLILNIST